MMRHGHDKRGRSTSAPAGRRLKEWNSPPKGIPWGWLNLEMMRSPAWRALSSKERDLLLRCLQEHIEHAGTENGHLVITTNNAVEDCGIKNRNTAVRSFRVLCAVGFLRCTMQGGMAYGDIRRPAQYALTWLPTYNPEAPPSNEWKRFSTLEEAEKAIAAMDQNQQEKQKEKTESRYQKRALPVSG